MGDSESGSHRAASVGVRRPSAPTLVPAVPACEAEWRWPLHMRVRFLFAVVIVAWAVIFALIAL